jgi:L-ascorbate peroxidase
MLLLLLLLLLLQLAGGPKLAMRYGRKDVNDPKDCAKEGNLPCE